jgi:hypothetical protein
MQPPLNHIIVIESLVNGHLFAAAETNQKFSIAFVYLPFEFAISHQLYACPVDHAGITTHHSGYTGP